MHRQHLARLGRQQPVDGSAQQVESAANVLIERQAGVCRDDLARAPVKQPPPEVGFERPDLMAYGRGGEAQFLGGDGEAAAAHGRFKHTQAFK